MKMLHPLGKVIAIITLVAVASFVVVSLALAQPHRWPLPGPIRAHQASTEVGDLALAAGRPVTLTAQEQAVLSRKQQLAHEFALVQSGKVSVAQFQRDWAAFMGGTAGEPVTRTRFPHISLCPISIIGVNYPQCDQSPHSINLTQESQINRYYCGPAAVEESLIALGATKGPKGENLLASPFPATGQHILAGPSYLATDLNTGTNWWSKVVPNTLNAWEHAHYYVPVNGPGMGGAFTMTDFINAVRLDVAAGRPILVGIRMDPYATSPHLIGYPTNQTHYHWIAIIGYAQNGDQMIYADSVHGDTQLWWWADRVPAYGTVSTRDIMYPLAETYGYVW